MLPAVYLVWSFTVARVDRVRRDDRGLTTTEIVVLTALLATLAFGAVAIISAAVMDKANSINLEGGNP